MKKAIVLIIGIGAYLWLVQFEHTLAMNQLNNVQNLYTSAEAQATAIASSNR